MLNLFLLLLFVPLNCFAAVIGQWKMVPGSEAYRYILVDLGETDVPLEKLSKYALPNTFAPQINNSREITYNQNERGYVLEDIPIPMRMSGAEAYCHGVNDKGDLLLSYGRSANDRRWSVCTYAQLCKQNDTPMNLAGMRGRDVFLRALSDSGTAIGCFKPSGMWRPMIWTKEEGLHHLGYFLGWDIVGNLWDVNPSGSVVGTLIDQDGALPFVWNKQWGLKRLPAFGWNWKVCTRRALVGAIQFDDLVIAPDDRVFGTFHSSDAWEENYVGAYWWDPHSEQIRPLDLRGMRLNAINLQNTLVGSWNGKAALCDLGGTPILLEELTNSEKEGWELLEASDINDRGDIVGFGLHDGKPHYFFFQREGLASP